MAQPHADSVTRAYELLANTNANMANAYMNFGNSIAQNFNDTGKSVIAYYQAQKDNEFREKAHNDDLALKNRSLDIEEKGANARNSLLNTQTQGQRLQNAQNELLTSVTHTKDPKTGEYKMKHDVLKEANKLGRQVVRGIANKSINGTGDVVNQSPISGMPSL